MISISDDGFVVLHRARYLYRSGELNEEDYRRMGDGDIPIGKISDEAYKDREDAKEIIEFINEQLTLPEPKKGDRDE